MKSVPDVGEQPKAVLEFAEGFRRNRGAEVFFPNATRGESSHNDQEVILGSWIGLKSGQLAVNPFHPATRANAISFRTG